MTYLFNIYARVKGVEVELGFLEKDTMSLVIVIGGLQQVELLPKGRLKIPLDYAVYLEFPVRSTML